MAVPRMKKTAYCCRQRSPVAVPRGSTSSRARGARATSWRRAMRLTGEKADDMSGPLPTCS